MTERCATDECHRPVSRLGPLPDGTVRCGQCTLAWYAGARHATREATEAVALARRQKEEKADV